ncbi:MAG: hypothetical protein FJ098_16145 [Deltaproteobacteria bacterium]|nr:hypothetical protein [Deltaproteobacteria bacterium]
MAALSGRIGFWSQLGTRERRLLVSLLIVLLLGSAAVAYLFVESKVEDLRMEFEDAQTVMEQLRQEARTFRVSMEKKEALENAIRKNDPKIQTAIDKIARKIQVNMLKNEQESQGPFHKAILRYDAKADRDPVILGEYATEEERRAARKATPIFQLIQPMEFDFVEFSGVLEFLNSVEDPANLMYVSRLEVHHKFGNPHFVRGKASVAMFIYQAATDEKEAE